MLKIAYHPSYCHSLPPGHRFPMEKYELIPQQLLHEGYIEKSNLFEPSKMADKADVLAVHCPEYYQKLLDLNLSRQEERKTGFPLSKELIERERWIMQGTIETSLYALEYGISLNIAGGTHHAFTNRGEGFCLLNDQAIAAQYLLNNGLAKNILIIDLDVHQGNGTAEIFRDKEQVFTFSMHGKNNYPLQKELSDIDVELLDGTSGTEYLNILSKHLTHLQNTLNPDFIFYQSGVDILETDKLGKLGVSIDACKTRDCMVFTFAQVNKIPIVCSMGGGYSPKLTDIVTAHANTFRLAQEMFF